MRRRELIVALGGAFSSGVWPRGGIAQLAAKRPPSGASGGEQPHVIYDPPDYSYWNFWGPDVPRCPWWVEICPWNRGSLVAGVDYSASMTVYPSTFPNNTSSTWTWPNDVTGGNVWGYNFLAYGVYGGEREPPTTIPYKQINNINTLIVSHDISLSGDMDCFDCMYDFALNNASGPQPASNQAFEVEIYVHAPPYTMSWLSNFPSNQKYYYTDKYGVQWMIVDCQRGFPRMLVFVKTDGVDYNVATIDFKELFMAAKSHGIMTGNEWFVGLTVGTEPQKLSGAMTINSISVNYS